MLKRHLVAVSLLAALVSGAGMAAQADRSALPIVTVTGATVIAFWEVPSSNAALVDDPDFASALDEQQYYWAETRDRLAAYGVTPLDQPGRRFRVRDGQTERLFSAPPDGAVIGYLLVEPGKTFAAIYRLQYPDELIAAATSFFGR